MNAVTKIMTPDDVPLNVSCNTAAGTVSVGRNSVRVSPAILLMVALLAKAYPATVPRDRMMKKINAGNKAQRDPAMCLRATMKRARDRLEPLGLTIIYTPNPGGSDLPGNYSLGRHTYCAFNPPKRAR